MGSGARIGLVAATQVVLVLAFVLLSPDADEDSNTASTPTTSAPPATTSETTTAERPSAAPQPPPAAGHEPTFETIRVAGGKPAGRVKRLTVKKGERAHIQVTSTDTSDEVHLHGYDIENDLTAGERVRFSFDAEAEGIFELELEGAGTQIAQLTVEP